MDKSAEIQHDRKGNVLYDKETKDTEIVKWGEKIEDYMAREVLPHIPDAKAFFEEDLSKKKPVIKTGAEIPFTRYFYKFTPLRDSSVIMEDIRALEERIQASLAEVLAE